MYKIKQILEDFVVKEKNEIKLGDSGNYSYFLMKKKNYNTLRAIQLIAKKLKINEKNIGFAGNKDKNAVTEQFISIKNGKKEFENVSSKDIELKYLGEGNEEIYLGNLKGNEFTIAVRNLAKAEIKEVKEKTGNSNISIPNYFGKQRFSNSNAAIGKAIIKNNFKEAIDLVIKSNSDCNEEIEKHIKKQKNDFVGALKIIPFRLLKLYIHSYQSFLFNKTLGQYIETIKNNKNTKLDNGLINETLENQRFSVPKKSEGFFRELPIIGFATEIKNNTIKKIINEIMQKENIDIRDFIIRAIPDLSAEGDERSAFMKINDFEILNEGKDELNENKEKITVKFSLPKGCFATVLVDYLFN